MVPETVVYRSKSWFTRVMKGVSMILTNEQSLFIFDKLYDWLTVHTPGSSYSKRMLIEYQQKVWDPVMQAVKATANQSSKNEEERKFLASALYSGPIYRIQNYSPRSKGYIIENCYFIIIFILIFSNKVTKLYKFLYLPTILKFISVYKPIYFI